MPSDKSRFGVGSGTDKEVLMGNAKRIGVLTAGGDSPGLNAAIRGLGKAAIGRHGMELISFRDGVRGLVQLLHEPH